MMHRSTWAALAWLAVTGALYAWQALQRAGLG